MAPELNAVEVGRRALADYEAVAGLERLASIRALAEPLAGTSVLHLAGAGAAGRPAALLGSLLPLMRDIGLRVEWRVLAGGAALERVARDLDHGLRGAETAIAPEDWREYRDAWARAGVGGADVVVAHDPAAIGAIAAAGDRREAGERPRWVWRCHLDASEPDPAAWGRARRLAARFDACVFPLRAFAGPGLPAERVHELVPGLDPLAPRNRDLPVKLAGDALRLLGIDLARPFCCQVGGLDTWHDPHAAIDAFRRAKEAVPELQLVVAGASGRDEGEEWQVAGEVADYAADADDLLVLTGYAGVGELELNAMQRLARAAVQTSLREGFGLAAAEALWKGTPVVATPSGGIPEQVRDGEEGFLAADPDALAARIVELVRDPALGIVLGAAGRERVRERFLVMRVLEDELRLLGRVLAGGTPTTLGA